MKAAAQENWRRAQYGGKRLVLAFLGAPLAGPLGLFIGFWIYSPSWNPIHILGGLGAFYLFATPVIFFFSLLLGVPFYLMLRILGRLTKWHLILGWALIGDISLLILGGGQLIGEKGWFFTLPPFALAGGLVGWAFWTILCRDQAKRSPSRPATGTTALNEASVEHTRVLEQEREPGGLM